MTKPPRISSVVYNTCVCLFHEGTVFSGFLKTRRMKERKLHLPSEALSRIRNEAFYVVPLEILNCLSCM